jgi:dienelactone hydrolase
MTVKTQMVEFPSNGGTTPAYLARPEGSGRHPAIVAIQDGGAWRRTSRM